METKSANIFKTEFRFRRKERINMEGNKSIYQKFKSRLVHEPRGFHEVTYLYLLRGDKNYEEDLDEKNTSSLRNMRCRIKNIIGDIKEEIYNLEKLKREFKEDIEKIDCNLEELEPDNSNGVSDREEPNDDDYNEPDNSNPGSDNEVTPKLDVVLANLDIVLPNSGRVLPMLELGIVFPKLDFQQKLDFEEIFNDLDDDIDYDEEEQ